MIRAATSVKFLIGNDGILLKSCRFFSVSSSKHQNVVNKKWIYAKKFEGEPRLSNFKYVEEELPTLNDGEFLASAEFLSVDPYMRPYMLQYPPGVLMIGGQAATVIDSKNAKFPVDSYIFGQFGWQTHTICDPAKLKADKPYILPAFGNLSRSLAVGALGMPGNTAYFGLLEICQPKSGENVVVSGAAGAVGSIVGQIAKIKGCNVVGIAGSDEKCEWLKSIGFDNAINYKTAELSVDLKHAAPNGIDCYFDNVGGHVTSKVLKGMNLFGRISVCGAISNYNHSHFVEVEDPQVMFVFKQLRQEGFVVHRWGKRWLEGIEQMQRWIEEGKIQVRETVTEGFENMPKAFIDMLNGGNIGKAIVKV